MTLELSSMLGPESASVSLSLSPYLCACVYTSPDPSPGPWHTLSLPLSNQSINQSIFTNAGSWGQPAIKNQNGVVELIYTFFLKNRVLE